MKTFLITGVTGFLGRSLAQKILNDGYKVIGMGRSDEPELLMTFKNFMYLEGDISKANLDQIDNITINGVFHLASQQPGIPNLQYKDFYNSNVLTTITLIDYFKSRSLSFFAYTSTISVFGQKKDSEINEESIPEPANFYALSKYNSEKILQIESKSWDTKVVVIRLQSIFGKDDGYGIVYTFLEQLKKNQEVELYSQGIIFRNLIHIDDAVKILKNIIEYHQDLDNYEIFQAASANSLKTLDIALIIKNFLKSDSKIVCSEKKYLYDWDVFIDGSKARSKLGFSPMSLEVAIDNYLKQQIDELP